MSESRSHFRRLLPPVTILTLILPLLFALASPVSAATITVCPTGPPDCDYATIQDAVNAAGPGDVIDVYPSPSYDESVDLGGHSGALTLRTVNAAGNPTPHTAKVNGGTTGPAFNTLSQHSGNITIDGFAVQTAKGSCPGCDYDSIHLDVNSNVVIRNVTASGGSDGIEVYQASGNVTVEDSQSNSNDSDGFKLDVGGNLTVTRCTANDNEDNGFDVDDVGKALTITNCTANGNSDRGFELTDVDGNLSITSSVVRDNGGDGVLLEDTYGDTVLINGSIVCGNLDEGLLLDNNITADATANWWGCTTGPGTGACDTIDEGSGTANYTPWIDTITASASVDPAVAGQPTVVSFQFSGGPPAVYLGEGPGDLHGDDPTFIVTTDNGTVTGGFINAPDGVLQVTLVPDHDGTATVWVDGPCGLDEQIVLGVRAAAAEFVPEPGSVVLLASGLVGLAGYAGLRLRKK